MARGILPYQELRAIPGLGYLGGEAAVQPASIDLTVGHGTIHRLRGEVMPREGESFDELLARAALWPQSLNQPLEPGATYLGQYAGVQMPDWLCGKVNPKSSTGRLDIHVRTVLPGVKYYDTVPYGYQGSLWFMITTKHFVIKLGHGDALAQLRVADHPSDLDATALRGEFARRPLLWSSDGTPLFYEQVATQESGVLALTVDLASGDIIGYVAKPVGETPVLEFNRTGHRIEDFFEPIYRRKGRQGLVLSQHRFYILRSRERVSVPLHLAGEMAPMNAAAGDIRTHYAGFFDPGFGHGRSGEIKGRPAVLEVRSFETTRLIEHGDFLAAFTFARMREVPTKVYGETDSHYADQEGPELSKHFRKV